MNLSEYQELSRATAIFPEIDGSSATYPELGLVNEAGEVAGKIKKIYRDENGVMLDSTKKALKDELGDVLWYLSQIADYYGIDLGPMPILYDIDISESFSADTMAFSALSLCRIASEVSYYGNQYLEDVNGLAKITELLGDCLVDIDSLCYFCDTCLADVAQTNIEKLQDRARRNVLQGSRDDR